MLKSKLSLCGDVFSTPLSTYQPEVLMQAILDQTFPGFKWAEDDGGKRTAKRFVNYLREYSPIYANTLPFEMTVFPAQVNQLIMSGPINFSSACMHHLLPYMGTAWVGYIPNRLMIGASKMPRLVKALANKPSTQEELCAEIASCLKHKLEAMGVAVVMRATHTCMSCRGVREEDAQLITSEMRGVFLTAGEARAEFLSFVNRGR